MTSCVSGIEYQRACVSPDPLDGCEAKGVVVVIQVGDVEARRGQGEGKERARAFST